jgi:uncharacterized membrane protein YbaN (DUF454 family)
LAKEFIKKDHSDFFKITQLGIAFITLNSFEQLAKKSNAELSKLTGEIEIIKKTLRDYDKTKSLAQRSEGYAILAIIVSLIAIVLPLICNKHG